MTYYPKHYIKFMGAYWVGDWDMYSELMYMVHEDEPFDLDALGWIQLKSKPRAHITDITADVVREER